MSDALKKNLRALGRGKHDDVSVAMEALAYIQKLEAERDALEADSQRLEWLQREMLTCLECEIDTDENVKWGMLDQGLKGWLVTPKYDDWREAVDAATAAEGSFGKRYGEAK